MEVKFAYLGHSAVRSEASGQTLSLSPNLGREAVAFDAPLRRPLRFREAISALHDVVISDLRFKKEDKTSYLEWKKRQAERENEIRRAEHQRLNEVALAKHEVPADFQKQYNTLRKKYWNARQQYADYLRKNDPALWRQLMPCDPIVTVAPDALLFECFSADESSYGCLSVERDAAFDPSDSVKLGTTNVDYSWDLYNHFQSLRSYRQTRFRVDPQGFEVATKGSERYREEKIDLPDGWLRGLLQIQAAMTLPMTRVTLSREAVYSIIAYLKRHRRETSPRAIRFELEPGRPPKLTLEPWELPINTHGCPPYAGPPTPPIRIWGRRRITSLSRLLPLAESFEVHLLGTGLPSFWVASMGEMRLTLGLSGWTVNDWTRVAALDLVSPPTRPSPEVLERVRDEMRARRSLKIDDLAHATAVPPSTARGALLHLARTGQVIHDLPAGLYRWRQILPQALGDADLGPEHPELAGAKLILAQKPVRIESVHEAPRGGIAIAGNIDSTPVEVLLDGDRNVKRGKCLCGYYRKFMLKNGPCRHMIALRRLMAQRELTPELKGGHP